MALIALIVVATTVYISCFKDDFTKEHIEKVVPFFILLATILVLGGTILSILGGG